MNQQPRNSDKLKELDFVARRISQGKKIMREEKVRRSYNMRARLRRETQH